MTFSPFKTIDILPNYGEGFTFTWEIYPDFIVEGPWVFHVELSVSDNGPWTDVSGPLSAYSWEDTARRVVNKDAVLHFRVALSAGANTYYSHTVMPYGEPRTKREYLLVRDMMRREILHARTLAGVELDFWTVSTFGPRCTVCIDPITGGVRDSACTTCIGVGRVPPYSGPYRTWCVMSEPKIVTETTDDVGVVQPRDFTIRAIGAPRLKKLDIVVDVKTGKRYNIDNVQVVAALRHTPVIQVLGVKELPTSDPLYKLNLTT